MTYYAVSAIRANVGPDAADAAGRRVVIGGDEDLAKVNAWLYKYDRTEYVAVIIHQEFESFVHAVKVIEDKWWL
jgi:hypothetical protein